MSTGLPAPTSATSDAADPGQRLTRLDSVLVGRLMWALVGIQLAARGFASASGFLYWDDFILQSRAARLPFPSVELLLAPHDGHVMPGAMATAWVVTTLAPLSPLAVTASLLIMQAAASSAVVLMLGRTFGRRPLVLAPLAVYLFAPLTLPSFLWWSAALNALPLQAAMGLAIWGHVGFLRHRSRAGLVVAFVATLVGIAFFEKAILVPFLLLGVTWVMTEDPGFITSLRTALTGHWRLWLAYAALIGGYVALFTRADTPDTTGPSLTATVRFIVKGIVTGFVPAAVGGPVHWDPVGYASGYLSPPAWLVLAASQVALVLVVWSMWARPRAGRAWVLLLGYLVGDLLAVALVRGGAPSGELLAMSPRYTADAAVVLAFVLAMALMPLADEAEPPRVQATRTWLSRRPSVLWATVFVAVDLFAVLTLLSSVAYTSLWTANPARPWIDAARRTLAAAPVDIPILPDPVPTEVLFGLAYPENLTSFVLAPVQGDHVFGPRTPLLQVFAPTGELVPGTVAGGATSLPSPEPGCWRVEGGRGLVRLDTRLPPWEYTVHLGYLSGGATGGTVALGAGAPSRISLTKGLAAENVRVTGGGSVLYVTTDDPDITVCINPAQVGGVVPEGWAEP